MRTAEEAKKIATESVTGIERASMNAVEKAINKASDDGLFLVEVFVRREVIYRVLEKLRLLRYCAEETRKKNEVGMEAIEISWR